ncbi:MAG: hypothetical protein MPW15_26655 [Candidatus Manganitrophus sp.]|nr:hypothetical protein [Candidatus Manganitrophus sp.]
MTIFNYFQDQLLDSLLIGAIIKSFPSNGISFYVMTTSHSSEATHLLRMIRRQRGRFHLHERQIVFQRENPTHDDNRFGTAFENEGVVYGSAMGIHLFDLVDLDRVGLGRDDYRYGLLFR